MEYLFQADPKAKEIDEEFEQYQKKLKEQKDAWAKEHPDEVNWQSHGQNLTNTPINAT